MDWSARNCPLVRGCGYKYNRLVSTMDQKLSASERSVEISTVDYSARNCPLVRGVWI